MKTSALPKPGLVAAALAVSAMVAIGVPLALAAPTAVPPSDTQGYLDSTARCAKPDIAVVFGTTEPSRVASCKTAGGECLRGQERRSDLHRHEYGAERQRQRRHVPDPVMDRLQQPAGAGEYDIGDHGVESNDIEFHGAEFHAEFHGAEFHYSVSIQDHGRAVDVQRATTATAARRSRRQHFLSPMVSDPSG